MKISIDDYLLNSMIDATPIAVMLINEDGKILYCNKYSLEFFDIANDCDISDRFSELSPEYQPSGIKSSEGATSKISSVFNTGIVNFNWLHKSFAGTEIPCEVTLVDLKINDSDNKRVIAAYLRNIVEYLTAVLNVNAADNYFVDRITDKQLFNTIADLSDELFFIFDTKTREVQFLGKGKENFGLKDDKKYLLDVFTSKGRLFGEDLDLFTELCKNIENGIVKPIDIRLIPKSGIPHYYKISYQLIYDNENNPLFAIGKAFDINEQKSLELRSKTDLLTNCFNKVTSENLIADTISEHPNGMHALFIVDIDNFKAINDNLGHHFGDLVLSEVAGNLRSYFRTDDILGRIGGDEFIVFLKNVTDVSIIESKAMNISKAFQNTYSGEHGDYKISGSIGIACFPRDGKTFEELYKASDKALYQSKLSGKDRYTFYSEDFLDGTMKNRTLLENANRIANSYFDSELVSTVFNLMYETKELGSSVNAVMQYIGKRTNSDRCYIFESFDDGKTYSNTYEWVANGITPEIDNLQGLTAEILGDFLSTADANGIVYSNDLTVLEADGAYKLMYDQGIKSFLHAQVREKNVAKLFLGLDDCTRTRVWSEKEINSLLYAAKMISIFLLTDKNH